MIRRQCWQRHWRLSFEEELGLAFEWLGLAQNTACTCVEGWGVPQGFFSIVTWIYIRPTQQHLQHSGLACDVAAPCAWGGHSGPTEANADVQPSSSTH